MLYNVIWGREVVKNMTFSRYIIYGGPLIIPTDTGRLHNTSCIVFLEASQKTLFLIAVQLYSKNDSQRA